MASGAPASLAGTAATTTEVVDDLEISNPESWDTTQHELNLDGSINKMKAPPRQSHFEVFVNPATSTASMRLREDVDKEAVLACVPLTEGVSGEIVQLFKAIDTDNSGELTEDDFAKLIQDDVEAVASTWQILASKFDKNDDGEVTMTEFREGFKSYGIEAVLDSCINFEAPFDWTISDWSREIARVFNASVKRECQVLRGWFAQFDGSRSELRTVASRVERLQDQILLGIYMDPASETQIHRLFDMLDTDGNGTLEASDFAVMAKNAGTADLWNQLKENFDENGDEQISLDEFKRHIADTVCVKIPLGSIPRKDWSWRQVIARLTEWGNRMVKEQCREILMYSVCGEYSSVPIGDEEIDGGAVSANFKKILADFGCGAQLGEPAFPGGEPAPTRAIASLAAAFGDTFDAMVAAAATPAAIGGRVRSTDPFGGPEGAVEGGGAANPPGPLNPFDVIQILETEVARQQRIIEDLQHEAMNRPPLTIAFGTSASNMISLQVPQNMAQPQIIGMPLQQ